MATQAHEHGEIEVETEDDPGYESGYDAFDEDGSITTSLKSSIYQYRREHGRTYTSYKDGGQYYFPNDEDELDRLNLQHQMFSMIHGDKLFSAPVPDSVQNALDVGTGTGIFAIDFADMYPNCTVLGVDMAPVQPNWVPPNLSFEIFDANDPWDFNRKFDYIHCRHLHCAVEEKKLFREVFDNLNPGGWFEMIDTPLPIQCDDDSLQGTALLRWTEDMLRLGKKIGVDFGHPWHYGDWIREAGFVNVQVLTKVQPLNSWPKDPRLKNIGLWAQVVFRDGVDAFSLKLFVDVLGWSQEELQVLLAQVRKDISNRDIHAYFKLQVVIAQKPEA